MKMICREDYSFWYLFRWTTAGKGRAESSRATKWMQGQFWRPSIFPCGLVSHQRVIVAAMFSQRVTSFEFPVSAGNRLKDKVSLLCWTLDLTWHTPHCGYRIVNNDICYGLLWIRMGECLTETTRQAFTKVVVSNSLKKKGRLYISVV